MFSHEPLRNALSASHDHPARIAAAAPAAAENVRNADRNPIASATMNTVAIRERDEAGAMNLVARMLSAMLACS